MSKFVRKMVVIRCARCGVTYVDRLVGGNAAEKYFRPGLQLDSGFVCKACVEKSVMNWLDELSSISDTRMNNLACRG